MRRLDVLATMVFVGLAILAARTVAQAPPAEEGVADPGPNRPDEPLAGEFSLAKATEFLDSASLRWQQQQKCCTCHTNYAYLYARPMVDADAEAHRQVRQFAEELVRTRWVERGPRWDAEVIATAAALAYNDRLTSGKLHPVTREALDRMWTVQREDGGWNWLKCNWPPMESDDHYGATLAALAVGAAPDDYARTPAAQAGLAKIREYLKNHPPEHVHHEAMLLWAARYTPDILSDERKKATIARLLEFQRPDGGWSSAALGDWKRADGKPQDFDTSDGYATGLVVYLLRQSGVAADDEAVRRGVAWLKGNQRQSGRWFTRSLNSDNRHYLTHAGTAMAVMALRACDEQ